MKTAVSIPDPLFKSAERAARALGLSRSELYARALAAYLERMRRQDITERLNRVYADQASAMDHDTLHMQIASLDKEQWP